MSSLIVEAQAATKKKICADLAETAAAKPSATVGKKEETTIDLKEVIKRSVMASATTLKAKRVREYHAAANALADRLASHLYADALKDGGSNAVFSGRNIFDFLAVIANGGDAASRTAFYRLVTGDAAANPTPAQMMDLLVSMNQGHRSSSVGLRSALGTKNEIELGTGLFSSPSSGFSPQIQELVSKVFNGAADDITKANDWVNQKTHGEIAKIYDDPLPLSATITTLWFKGAWDTVFDKHNTSRADFFNLDGARSDVQMMRQNLYVPMVSGQGFTAISIPFAGKGIVLDVILPDYDSPRGRGTRANLSGLLPSVGTNPESLFSLLDAAHSQKVEVWMPRFSAKATVYGLLPLLRKVGALGEHKLLFDGNPIDDIVHIAKYRQDEEGAIFAAVTGGATRSAVTRPTRFEVDRPFLFFLRHKGDPMVGSSALGQGLITAPEPN